MTERILPADAKLIPPEAECVFQGVIYDVYQWPQEVEEDGKKVFKTFEMLRRPDTVMIIALDPDGNVLVNDERQPGGIVRKNHLPVGRVDPSDESVLAAAQRELREETGYEFANWDLLDVVQMEKKIEWFTYLFVAQNALRRMAQNLDAGEDITNKFIPLTEVIHQPNVLRYFPWLHDVETVDDLINQKYIAIVHRIENILKNEKNEHPSALGGYIVGATIARDDWEESFQTRYPVLGEIAELGADLEVTDDIEQASGIMGQIQRRVSQLKLS